MTSRIVAIFILVLLAFGLLKSKQLKKANTILYGVFLSAVYFITIPLIFYLFLGQLQVPFFPTLSTPPISEQISSLLILAGYIICLFISFPLAKKSYLFLVKKNKRVFSHSNHIILYYFFVVLYFCVSIYILISSGALNGGHWYRSRGDFIEQQQEIAIISLFLIWGLRLLVVSYTFELLTRKLITIWSALIVIIIVSAYELAFVGNRIVILMFGIAGLFYIYKNYKFRTLVIALIIISPLALLMGVYQDVRYLLYKENIIQITNLLLQVLTSSGGNDLNHYIDSFLKIFEYVDLIVMLNLFSDVNTTVEPIYGASLLKIFVWFIPRSIWPNKPETISVLAGNFYLPGRGTSLVVLLFGELHFNFGAWGIALTPIILLILAISLQFIARKIPLNNYLSLLIGFLIFRLPISDIVVSVVFAFIVYFFCINTLKLFILKKH